MDKNIKKIKKLEHKLLIAISALKIIGMARGGRMAIDSSGHVIDMPYFEGNVAIQALEEIENIK